MVTVNTGGRLRHRSFNYFRPFADKQIDRLTLRHASSFIQRNAAIGLVHWTDEKWVNYWSPNSKLKAPY